MTTDLSIQSVRDSLDAADSLLGNFHSPWDADDIRPLRTLKDALDAQQRALTTLLSLVESEQKISRAHRRRVDQMEYAR